MAPHHQQIDTVARSYIALQAGAKIVEVNTQPTELTPLVDLRLDMDAEAFSRQLQERLDEAPAPESISG